MENLFLLARIAGRTVAIDAEQVESVVDIGAITPIPRTVAAIRGLAALRSKVVTVVDTRRALNEASAPGRTRRAVITNVHGHPYALLVDALDDIERLEPAPVDTGMAFDVAWRPLVTGLVEREGEPVPVVDLKGLIPVGAGGGDGNGAGAAVG